jgi:hypothetical protein
MYYGECFKCGQEEKVHKEWSPEGAYLEALLNLEDCPYCEMTFCSVCNETHDCSFIDYTGKETIYERNKK